MRSKFGILFFVFGVLFSFCNELAYAQQNQVVHLDNHVYIYIKNLQQRGHFTELNPTSLPYTRGEIDRGLQNIERKTLSRTERFWFDQITQEFGIKKIGEDEFYLYGMLEGGFDLNNTLEPNGLRPQADDLFFLPNGASNLYGEKGNFSAQMGLRHKLFYDQDRIGVNALSRYYVRSEDYYIGYQGDFLKAYAGRYTHQWGPYQEASTVITPNSRSFDNLNISVGNSWFEVSGIFAELDNLGKDGTFDRTGKNLIDGTKRYLAIHRIDIKINDGLRLGYFDGFIYSSQNSVPSLKFISPVNFFFFDRNTNPLNDEFNAFFGGMIWGQHRNVTANLQVMIDDIVIKGGSVESDIEPTTFAITHSVNVSGVTDFMDIGYEAEAISYQTYNTDQAEGRYLFLKRGIANQYTDYVYGSVYSRIHMHKWLPGLTLTPRISYLLQGEQEINQDFVSEYPNGNTIDVILTGREEKTSRFSLDVLYNPIPQFWVDASVGYNYTDDHLHIPGRTTSRITGNIEAGFRISIDSHTFK